MKANYYPIGYPPIIIVDKIKRDRLPPVDEETIVYRKNCQPLRGRLNIIA